MINIYDKVLLWPALLSVQEPAYDHIYQTVLPRVSFSCELALLGEGDVIIGELTVGKRVNMIVRGAW